MDIFSLFTLCGGLAFFLFGMRTMSASLEKTAGGRLELTLKRMTANPLRSLLLGAGITIAIQSSSALTVMLVGFVNSGIMALGQTVGVIMGANIGTTLTAWILSLTGIDAQGNFALRLLRPESFAPVLALTGVLMIMISRRPARRAAGTALVGFAVLMYGMQLMGDAVSPLADMPAFSRLLTAFENPLLGVLVGAAFTGVIQSSAASVGILQVLAATGTITYGMAIPIVMGQNIGTCVTALLSSIGVSRSAKRVAVIHISFNVIGTAVCLSLYCLGDALFHFSLTDAAITPVSVAAVHSVFNIVTTILLLPFSRQLERLACLILPDRPAEEGRVLLDDRLLLSPGFAVTQCRENVTAMAELAKASVLTAMDMVLRFEKGKGEQVRLYEDELDQLEDQLGAFLTKLSAREITPEGSGRVSQLLHALNDLERMGDHALNIAEGAEQIAARGLRFSEAARQELTTLSAALTEILSITVEAFSREDAALARKVEPLEEVIDGLTGEIRDRHLRRLQSGECDVDLGVVLSELLSNYERVSDHCSNLAAAQLQAGPDAAGTHSYLQGVKAGSAEFRSAYEGYLRKYRLS